MISKKRNEWTY